MPWQFLVVDGADKDHVFLLPERGVVVIGSSSRHADICLHDLFVQRTHCEAEVAPDGTVQVRNLRPIEGILVNKVRAEQQQLNPGDVLRIGNSHLRLEAASQAGPAPTPRPSVEPAAETPAAPETKADTPGPLPSLPPERLGELVGHVLGRYQLREVLARDGYRAVFLAIDRKTQETVAVKVLSPRFPARQEEAQRFIEVMRRALPIGHEALVPIRGVGKSGPYTWIARDHVPGESLAGIIERIAEGKTKAKWQSGLRLARQLAGVLKHLHQHHVMHGRLSPHSVLVNTEAKQNRLANLMLEQALAGSQLQAEMRGPRRARDVAYLSPEQCEAGAFVDEMSDQYALGALVYARLTGRPPFNGATPEETMKQIRTAVMVRPRERNSSIPPAIDAVVMRMLSRHQEDRYPSPAALLADLEEIRAS